MVADGMGAHAVGELASKMACDNIPHNYTKTKTGGAAEAITKAYREVGALIHSRASANRDFQGMGTTCSTLLLLPEGALIAHVGDSRVYRIRNNRIDQLSFDHSLVWELVRRNHLTPEHANLAVPKNVITRSLGPDPSVEVDIEGPLAVEPNDVYLLCSDGLSGPVTDPELGAFAANFHPEDACRFLINLTNLRGGPDNITVVILRIGPWVEPDTAHDLAAQGTAKPNHAGKKAPIWKSALSQIFRHRNATPATVEDHPYRTAECPISLELIDRYAELTRRVQAHAVEQAWSLDWTQFAKHRRAESEARAAGNLRGALRHLGEMIALLGVAARFHRKTSHAV
jgi:protein phosphatase